MRFKIEISLLALAIAFYIQSVFCYSYEVTQQGWLPITTYPYRDYAIPLTGIATTLLIIAAILYSKRR